ncbi:MAG: ABC transporter permease [Rhodanobacter denitrificans]|uniref:ABC transporter permease n=1 Tax=Rhodanobacter denitrificans TaxID=666685 RepID=A0A2W5MQ47_9GAMM|nr:MAG: ABC transporter permease [Rhodanobacter denitrificans]
MRRFGEAMRDTFRDVLADRYAVMALVGAVLMYSVFYPSAYRHEVASSLPIVVVDQDHGSRSHDLVRRLDQVRGVRIAGRAHSAAEARRGIERGRFEGLVLIPSGLERDTAHGGTGHVVVQASAAYLSRGSNVVAAVNDAVGSSAARIARDRAKSAPADSPAPVRLVQRPLFNTREGYGSGVVPGVSEVIVHQTLLIGSGVVLGGRRRRNGGRRLRYSPGECLGMLAAFACLGIPSLLYYTGFTFWVQDYPRGGNLPGLLLGGPLYVVATILFGLFLGSFFTTRERAFQCVTAVSLVLFFLASLTWPASSMPPVLGLLAKLLPTTPGINLMVKFNQMGARLDEALTELLNLAGLAVLYGTLVWLRFRPGTRDADHRRESRVDPLSGPA